MNNKKHYVLQKRYMLRRISSVIVLGITFLATIFGLTSLLLILGALFYKGMAGLTINIFTQITPPPDQAGGLANALFGSLIMTGIGTIIGTPIGVLAGTYLAEYGKITKLAAIVRFINSILLSTPSIIIGIFVYEIIVLTTKHFSGWAGGLALSLLVIPIVARTTEDMLMLVPSSLREAASALGASPVRVITKVIYRAAFSGITTGILLAVGRIAGETAPLLFTALNNQFWSSSINSPLSNLPVTIYQFILSPYSNWQQLAWSAALIITIFILILNIFARIVSARYTNEYK